VTDLRRFMAELALDPALLADYVRDPAAGLKSSRVPAREQAVLRTGRELDFWQLLLGGGAKQSSDAKSAEVPTPRQGQLAVVGTGIRSVGQLTVEAIAWMREADALLYLVADPISEEIVRSLNPTAISLQGYYGEGAGRMGSYEAMVEHILSCVRNGKRTCAAFYGHPGVFAFPSHESIRRARSEGHIAFMLPAVSAEDCLFADLGIDPSVNGLQTYEASDFLLHERIVDTSSQLILWQVGVVGDFTFRATGYDLRGFSLLIQRLCEFYPFWHDIVLYQAALFLGFPPTIQRMQLGQVTASHVNAATTMYLPPARATVPNARMQQALRQSQGAQ
jgi:Tetrapyrrole (Corrin/Porphyrin) Methylases